MTRPALPRMSMALRMALATALFGLVLIVIGLAVGYLSLSQQLDARAAAEMNGRRELVEHLIGEASTIQGLQASRQRLNDVLIGHDDLRLELANGRTGELIGSYSGPSAEAAPAPGALAPSSGSAHAHASGRSRVEAMQATVALGDGTPVRYYMSIDRHEDAKLLGGFVRASALTIPILLLVVALGAWAIARMALAPLLRFRRLAAAIGEKSLDQRVSASDLPAELAELAREFNAMLERIDRGYRRLQEFSADLAHELRTPIATLMGRDQVALSHDRTVAQLRDVLEGDIEELERLSSLIADMLFIAQAEHGPAGLKLESVDLAAEARRVGDYLSLAGEEKGVTVQVHGHADIAAERLLVQRAITNLMSNAIRHARADSVVRVDVATAPEGTRLQVANVGPGIAPEHLDRIFDRFYREDASRTRHSGGTGLGLAIVRSIMEAHRGSATAASDAASGTTVFTLFFPKPRPGEEGPPAGRSSAVTAPRRSPARASAPSRSA